MYRIIYGRDGKYHCEGRLQDGTERWTNDTLDEAVDSLKKFARTMNGDNCPDNGEDTTARAHTSPHVGQK